MRLDSTLEAIRAYMGSSAATNNPIFVSSWDDHTSTTLTPGNSHGTLNGTTAVVIVANPASSTYRSIDEINIWNYDTISHSISIEFYDNVTARKMFEATLDPGDSLRYNRNVGWGVYNNQGVPRAMGVQALMGRLMVPIASNVTANITGTKTITSTQTALTYVGRAGRAASSVTLRYNVTTAGATITWAELGVFKGDLILAANSTLTRLGYADVSGVVNSTGRKSTLVTLSTNIAIGDEIWIGIGCQATTAVVIRAYSLIEDCQAGTVVMMVARPSTVASPTSWTVNNAVGPWMYAYLN
jgi:hypothetical protein